MHTLRGKGYSTTPDRIFFATRLSFFDRRIRSTCRRDIIFCSAYAPMDEDTFTYLYHGHMMSRKFSTAV